MSNSIVDTEQLKSVLGYERPGDIERCLTKNGVRYICGKNGPVTTTDAINAALGVTLIDKSTEKSDFEFA